MAELSPEQIAKGYYTDISGIGTALDKVQEQEALRAKAKQAQQDKLYQGIKDVTSVLDNKFTATGTAADPILLSKINKMKGDLTQGIVDGKISPSAAYMTAGSKVADINNLAATISQYRQNVEKKIAEIKKDRPELNSELLMNDVIKAGLFDPQTGEIVTPNSNYDYVSTILDQDRTGRYSDKNLIHKISAEEFIKTPGSSFTLKLGNNLESEATVRPGQKVIRGRQGGLEIGYDKIPVGESIQETTVMQNGKPVKKKVNVGMFEGATDQLINYFEGNRLAKRGALIEMGEMDEYADSNPEYGKKWNSLNDQEKYRVAALNYAIKHFGTAGSKVEKPSVSAEAQLAHMYSMENKDRQSNYVNPVVQAAQVISQNFKTNNRSINDPAQLLKLFDKGQMIIGRAPSKDDATSVRPVYGSMTSGKENGREYILVEPLSNQGLEGTTIYAGPGSQPAVYSSKKLKYYLDSQADMNAFFNNYSALNDDRSKVIEKTQY